ncbi:hypothetical protein Dimus_011910 [Dionaea muscipula]
MEGVSEEWSIEEYSLPEERNSRLRWICDRGLWLGKRIAVTGVVISSAPFVLPPLVVLSALGVAFSVPFGFVFVSYACTEKLVSSLLREPTAPCPPTISEYGVPYIDDEEDCVADGGRWDYEDVESGYQEGCDREAEEIQDGTKKGVEMRMEFVNEFEDEIKQAESLLMNDHGKTGLHVDAKVVSTEEDGYVENVVEYLENQAPVTSDVGGDILKGIKEAKERILSVEDERDELPTNGGENDCGVELVEELAAVAAGRVEEGCDFKFGGVEEGVLKRETTGLIEPIRVEGKAETVRTNHESSIEETSQTTNKSEDLNTPFGNEMGKSGKRLQNDNRGTGRAEMEMVKEIHEEVKLHADMKNEYEDDIIKDVLIVFGLAKHAEDDGVLIGGVLSNEDSTEAVKNLSSHSLNQGNGARVPHSHSHSVSKRAEGETCTKDLTGMQPPAGDFHGLPMFSGASIPTTAKIALLQEAEVLGDEGNVWEQIHAIRTIIGYKEVPNTSCNEELKALYVFTGVEPPASEKDVKVKLQFLKSIIGVK